MRTDEEESAPTMTLNYPSASTVIERLRRRLLEVGATEPTLPREWGDYFTRAAMPPVRVEGFNMSSVSQAS